MNFCREIQTTSELLQIFSNTIQRETAFYLTVLLEQGLQEVNQLKAKMEEESALIWVKFEAKIQGESAQISDNILEQKLEEVYEIEANIQRESAQMFDQVLEQHLEQVWTVEANNQR